MRELSPATESNETSHVRGNSPNFVYSKDIGTKGSRWLPSVFRGTLPVSCVHAHNHHPGHIGAGQGKLVLAPGRGGQEQEGQEGQEPLHAAGASEGRWPAQARPERRKIGGAAPAFSVKPPKGAEGT